MNLTSAISKRNYYSLLWHAGFLAFASNFIDVDTIIPAMMADAGGTAMHIGILTAIMLGGSSFTQLIFAPFISNFEFKKKFLLSGISARILALLLLGILLLYSSRIEGHYEIALLFVLITIFSVGGAFANISFTDILGKSLLESSRKPFFSIRLVVNGIILFGSAFLARYVLNSEGYPLNYSRMFFIGFMALAVASLGFWNIKEVVPSKMTVKNPSHFLLIIRNELKENKKLIYFLGFVNTMGISSALLPFMILYAKENFVANEISTGNLLLFKVIGGVLTGLLLFLISRKFKYRGLLYLNTSLALIAPLLMLLIPSIPTLHVVFFLGGIVFASYTITMNGVLLEVSGRTNRALYTGIAGAGNILPAIFPLLGGLLVQHFGFLPFLFLFIAIILFSFFFIHRLQCSK
ncbi:MAG: MFS transporter [Bacteroidota bacterium]